MLLDRPRITLPVAVKSPLMVISPSPVGTPATFVAVAARRLKLLDRLAAFKACWKRLRTNVGKVGIAGGRVVDNAFATRQTRSGDGNIRIGHGWWHCAIARRQHVVRPIDGVEPILRGGPGIP